GLLRDLLTLAGDDLDADGAGLAHELGGDRAVEELLPARPVRTPQDDLGHVVRLREGDHVVGNAAARYRDRLAAQPLRQPERIGNTVTLDLTQSMVDRGLDIERGPLRLELIGDAAGLAHELRRDRILAHADEQALAGRPGAGNRVRLHV